MRECSHFRRRLQRWPEAVGATPCGRPKVGQAPVVARKLGRPLCLPLREHTTRTHCTATEVPSLAGASEFRYSALNNGEP
jgi:hypothetical protein